MINKVLTSIEGPLKPEAVPLPSVVMVEQAEEWCGVNQMLHASWLLALAFVTLSKSDVSSVPDCHVAEFCIGTENYSNIIWASWIKLQKMLSLKLKSI